MKKKRSNKTDKEKLMELLSNTEYACICNMSEDCMKCVLKYPRSYEVCQEAWLSTIGGPDPTWGIKYALYKGYVTDEEILEALI